MRFLIAGPVLVSPLTNHDAGQFSKQPCISVHVLWSLQSDPSLYNSLSNLEPEPSESSRPWLQLQCARFLAEPLRHRQHAGGALAPYCMSNMCYGTDWGQLAFHMQIRSGLCIVTSLKCLLSIFVVYGSIAGQFVLRVPSWCAFTLKSFVCHAAVGNFLAWFPVCERGERLLPGWTHRSRNPRSGDGCMCNFGQCCLVRCESLRETVLIFPNAVLTSSHNIIYIAAS